jgi:hypothetical protein
MKAMPRKSWRDSVNYSRCRAKLVYRQP